MNTLAGKVGIAASLALTALLAAPPASAQPRHEAGATVYDAQANPIYGFGPRVSVLPGDMISGDRLIGRDPFIRDQMLRAYNSGRVD
jgi:hypothetical protein